MSPLSAHPRMPPLPALPDTAARAGGITHSLAATITITTTTTTTRSGWVSVRA